MTELNHSIESFDISLDLADERNSKPKAISLEISQSKERKEKE